MNEEKHDKLPLIEANSESLIVIDETNSTRDATVRPMQGVDRQRAEQYWADLKKYCPKEYEELMKTRQLKP
jgi:hypothetical protein